MSGQGKYRTGSCMVFPLFSGQTAVGVLTFADKMGEAPFEHPDFNIGLEISPSLALLLDNHRMHQTLFKKQGAA